MYVCMIHTVYALVMYGNTTCPARSCCLSWLYPWRFIFVVAAAVSVPKIEQPKIEQPKIEQPKIEQPKIEQPKIEQPKTKQQPMHANDLRTLKCALEVHVR
jgi:hypothetical protein